MASMQQALLDASVVTKKMKPAVSSFKENHTIDLFAGQIRADLLAGKYTPAPFKLSSDVEKHLVKQMAAMAKLGDFSYDPSIGEVIIHFDESIGIDMFGRLDDGRVVHNVLVDFFEAQGWEKVSVIPARIGCNKALIRLQTNQLTAENLTKKK